MNVVTAPSRAEEVRGAGARLIAWTIDDDEEALTALWRYATCAKRAWAGERAVLNYLVGRYDAVYASLREPLLSRRNDIFVFDRALIPAMVVGDPSYAEAARAAQAELRGLDGLADATELIEAAIAG